MVKYCALRSDERTPICQDSSLRRIGLDVTWKEQGGCYRNSQLWAGDEIVITPMVSSDVWNTTSVFPITTKRRLEDTFSSLPTGLNYKQEFSAGNLRGTVNRHNSKYYCVLTVTNLRMQMKICTHSVVIWREKMSIQSRKYFILSFPVTGFAENLNKFEI